jgi:HD superfamily phosphohydrolase
MKINDQVYGEQIIDNGIIKKIINTKEMQRLKGIHQHGTWHIMNPRIDTSRFEHSLGVFFLLRKFNASLEEQIAGLIHDVSHFTFSHVIDYVFGEQNSQEFAEKFQENIIKNSSIFNILKEDNMNIEFILNKHNFKMLENDLPDICADRLDYLFRDSIIFENLNHKIVDNLLNSLVVKNKEFVINNEENAIKIARLYLEMSKAIWVNPLQSASYQILADSIKIAFEKGIIKEKDFHSTDIELFKKLENSRDKKIIELLEVLKNLKVKETSKKDYDFYTNGKARYIDPKFLDGNKIKRVSDVDKKFKDDIKQFQKWVKEGFYIKIIR